MTFNNNTVSVVIGGTSGIGAAVARALMQRPGRVETLALPRFDSSLAARASTCPGSVARACERRWRWRCCG